jgi:hypothetical protein
MKFFNSGLFWFIEGILATIFVLGFRVWMEDRGVRMNWWKWGLLGIWVLFAGFTIAFVGTSLGENETTAAFRGGVIFGVISIVSGVGLWRVIHRGRAARSD